MAGKGQPLEPVWLFKGPHSSAASPFQGRTREGGPGLADARTRPVTLEYSAEAAHERPRPRPMPVRHARQTVSILTVCVSCVSSGHRTPELGGDGAARDDQMASDSGTAWDGGAAGTLVGAGAPVRPAWRASLFRPKADGSHVWEGPSDAGHMQTARFGSSRASCGRGGRFRVAVRHRQSVEASRGPIRVASSSPRDGFEAGPAAARAECQMAPEHVLS